MMTCWLDVGGRAFVEGGGRLGCEVACADGGGCRICLWPCFRLRCGGTVDVAVAVVSVVAVEERVECNEDASLSFGPRVKAEIDWLAWESDWSRMEGGLAERG